MKRARIKTINKYVSHLNISYDPLCMVTRFLPIPHYLNIQYIKLKTAKTEISAVSELRCFYPKHTIQRLHYSKK